ncbi:MAG: hypothetical protein ACTS5I_17660 [Rhodanobacter sp.]
MNAAAERDLLDYINVTPAMQSLLYDLDMLPEQLQRAPRDWCRMLIIAAHWRANQLERSA